MNFLGGKLVIGEQELFVLDSKTIVDLLINAIMLNDMDLDKKLIHPFETVRDGIKLVWKEIPTALIEQAWDTIREEEGATVVDRIPRE